MGQWQARGGFGITSFAQSKFQDDRSRYGAWADNGALEPLRGDFEGGVLE